MCCDDGVCSRWTHGTSSCTTRCHLDRRTTSWGVGRHCAATIKSRGATTSDETQDGRAVAGTETPAPTPRHCCCSSRPGGGHGRGSLSVAHEAREPQICADLARRHLPLSHCRRPVDRGLVVRAQDCPLAGQWLRGMNPRTLASPFPSACHRLSTLTAWSTLGCTHLRIKLSPDSLTWPCLSTHALPPQPVMFYSTGASIHLSLTWFSNAARAYYSLLTCFSFPVAAHDLSSSLSDRARVPINTVVHHSY